MMVERDIVREIEIRERSEIYFYIILICCLDYFNVLYGKIKVGIFGVL